MEGTEVRLSGVNQALIPRGRHRINITVPKNDKRDRNHRLKINL